METYRVIGGNGSPYSMKMRAIFRYRRIPHIWVMRTPDVRESLRDVKPMLIPVVEYPDGSHRTDSTPIALDLEARIRNGRSIQPDHPGLAFLSHLIEDMADEWLTKCMFHYRFAYEESRRYGPHWAIDDSRPDLTEEADFQAARAAFLQRQSGRMAMVGCTPENAPLIEATYHRVLAILEANVRRDGFLFGSRPSLADFGLFGQLKTLATDPAPLAVMRAEAPHTEHWVRRLDDASGVEGEWRDLADLSPAVVELLKMAGEIYLPFLAANMAAAKAGADKVSLEIDSKPYSQNVFRYQAKCLFWLREHYQGLDAASRDAIEPILGEAGCLPVLETDD